MKALILAGGYGKRLRPLTYTIAKQLVPVANRPIIHYVIDQIRSVGVKEVGVVLSPHTGHQIKEILSYEQGLEFSFITQEKPLGLAHAVITAQDFLAAEPFIMYLGDNLIGEPINDLVKRFDPRHEDGVILLKEVEDPRMFGVAETDDNGRVISLVEKPENPPSSLALVGVYVFGPAIHRAIAKIKPSGRGEYEITDAISELLRAGKKIRSEILTGWWLDTGKKDDLLKANRVILDEYGVLELKGDIDERSKVEGRVKIEAGAKVESSRIQGPLVIGQDTMIKDSHIGPYTAIGDRCQIIDSSIDHSVVMEEVSIFGVAGLYDSIIGRKAEIEKKSKAKKGIRLTVGDDAHIVI